MVKIRWVPARGGNIGYYKIGSKDYYPQDIAKVLQDLDDNGLLGAAFEHAKVNPIF